MRPFVLIPLLAAAAWLAGCGGSDRADAPAAPSDGSTTTRTTATAPEPGASLCESSEVVSTTPMTRATGRGIVDAAAARSTRAGHRFRTKLTLSAGALRATGVLDGRRLPTNRSEASLRWDGVAGVALPDLDLRIVNDRLYVRRDRRWSDLGPASGVSLDVGRELLDHPSLLTPRRAASLVDGARVTFAAPASQLRAYATTERRGPVTDLLASARRLDLTAAAVAGRLVADRFTLVATAAAIPGLRVVRAGTRIELRGATSYCPLRRPDRATISAPRVSD